MSDEDDKIVDLKKIKRERRSKEDDKAIESIWYGLGHLWMTYAANVEARRTEGEFCLSGSPSAVFTVLFDELVSLARAMKVEDALILDTLVNAPLVHCEPKGRLYQLLTKASNLLEYGDEDAWDKMLREMHAQGKLSDEELARESEIPQ